MHEKYSYLLKTNPEITRHLISIGSNNFHETIDQDLEIFCFQVAQEGNVPLMNQILARHLDIINKINTHRNHEGYTILQKAALHDHPEMVEFLIDKGADDVRAKGNLTSLELVCLYSTTISSPNTKRIIKLLLPKANPDELDIFLHFISYNQEDYPGVYEELLPIAQEVLNIQPPLPDQAIETIKNICEKSSSPFNDETIKAIKSLLAEAIPEQLDEYLNYLETSDPHTYTNIYALVYDFRFGDSIDGLLSYFDGGIGKGLTIEVTPRGESSAQESKSPDKEDEAPFKRSRIDDSTFTYNQPMVLNDEDEAPFKRSRIDDSTFTYNQTMVLNEEKYDVRSADNSAFSVFSDQSAYM